MKKVQLLLALFLISSMFAQTKKVLIYHETNGYRHNGAIDKGIPMITNLGYSNGLWNTDSSQSSSVFTASNLAQYHTVVFLNTTGADESGSDGDLLTASEKQAFENFIINGGGFVGIHSATDTYRDGSWPFYNELVGAIVQSDPNHTDHDLNATMTVINNHPAVDFLSSTWNKDEEYYYWELNGGLLCDDNTVLLEVESTGSNSYDAPRPIAWYKETLTVEGTTYTNIRSFYTALGHNGSDYSDDSNFQKHIEEAIKWTIRETLSITDQEVSDVKAYPNPTQNIVTLSFGDDSGHLSLQMYDVLGKIVMTDEIEPSILVQSKFQLDISTLKSGVYLLSLKTASASKTIKIIRQ